MGCNKCGICCEKLTLPKTPYELKHMEIYDEKTEKDLKFILKNWELIEQKEKGYHHRYKCKFFDVKSRQCNCYNERPPICIDYPYLERKNCDIRISELESKCGYIENLRDLYFVKKELMEMIS